MKNFCESSFWDYELTWNTTDPYFTPCFEESIVAIFPVAFLLLFAFVDIANFRTCQFRQKSLLSNLNLIALVKIILVILLIIAYAVDLIRLSTQVSAAELFISSNLDTALQLVGYVSVLSLYLLTHYAGIYNSGIQFLFWCFSTLSQGILFRTAIRKFDDDDVGNKEQIIYLTRLIVFPLICVRLIMECFNENMLSSDRPTKRLGNPSPDKTSTFLSKLLFLWYDGLAWVGYKRTLSPDDLWDLNPIDSSEKQISQFSKFWKQEEDKASRKNQKTNSSGKTSLAGVLVPIFKCYGTTFAFATFIKVGGDMLVFVQPEMLKALVAHVTSGEEETWKGYLYTAIICLAAVLQSILTAASSKRFNLIGMRIRTVLSNAIYRKALVASNASKNESTVGEVVNLMSVDAQKFADLMPPLNAALSAPLLIVISVYLLYDTLGPSVFAGVGYLLLILPVNAILMGFVRRLQMQQMKLKDERIKLTSEVMNGIKVLKLYAWEISYQQHIEEIRANEIILLKKIAMVNTLVYFLFGITPIMVATTTFTAYGLSDPINHSLNAERAFVSISLFNIIRIPMVLIPNVAAMLVQVLVSVKRLNKYLNTEELDKTAVTHDEKLDSPIVIENGTFSWSDENVTLKDINFRAKPGELIAVVGTIGSGKSSLLCALLGDMKKHEGLVNTKGPLAYVAQGAWIQNATLQENITFGDKLNKTKYEKVIEACALKSDLDILPEGDQTEIGEKGVNLSGGQKQRVSLARAAYRESSVYLFDDPLSAVDAHVGKHIFANLIGPNGFLRETTRILVTHGVSFLPQVDRIVVMKNGQISESGSYKELLIKRGEFAEFLFTYLDLEDEGDIDPDKLSMMHDMEEVIGTDELQRKTSANRSFSKAMMKKLPLPSKEEVPEVMAKVPEIASKKVKLIEAEAMVEGNVKLKVFVDYFKSAGFFVSVMAVFMTMAANALTAYGNIWLADWSTQVTKEELNSGTTTKETTNKYLSGLGYIAGAQAISNFLGSTSIAVLTVAATKALHAAALSRVLRAPMSYFDTTLLGRLINRFAKDVDIVDNVLPITLRPFLYLLFNVLASFVVISYTTPIFTAFIIPIGIVYFFLQRFYIATNRQLKRLEAVSRSPIYSHFGETLSGSTTIRAFQMEEQFISESERRIDLNQKCYFPFIASNIWLTLRLEFMGALIILFTCFFCLLSKDNLDSGAAGLAISYALQVTGLLNICARSMSEVETNIVSVERISELKETPQEADWENPGKTKLSPAWPSKGEIVFHGYMTRYREGLDLVLKGITCTIQPGEKIGVVGRTGAGKSSLTLALFRLIEPTSGQILIDGVDITQLGLHELRKKITIIPQDPVLFSGTLRRNLDPFNQYSDDEVWKCLELAHLKSFVVTFADGLYYSVEEEGKNFSVGQRQLICLARALLRKTKILVLDEATAAVDLETDDLIQATIRKEFADCSVITIAHRLNTIMDSNRVLVLDKGEIREFDTPENLLADSGTIFWGLAHEAKLV